MPVASMTFGTLVLLILLAAFLIVCFDWTASQREENMVEQGFQRLVEQYEKALVPQSDWDDAIEKLDHRFDTKFADANFGSQLYTFNGVTHTFFVDGANRVIYASVNGKHASTRAFRPFAGITAGLLVPVRKAEAARPPITRVAVAGETVTKPIQSSGLVRIGDTVYIMIATLIQPDFGRILPKGPRAPVAVTAMPIDQPMLRTFASRYLVDDLEIVPTDLSVHDGQAFSLLSGKAHFRLRSSSGTEIAALAWTPRRPGVLLLEQLKWPLLAALVLLAFAGWVLIRRCGMIVDELILSEEQAKHLGYHDQLTGVPNRALLFERLPRLLASAGGSEPRLAVLAVDLDRFKEVNDTLGHPAGDRLLKTLAERLQAASAATGNALIARLGGDEFILACPVEDRQAAEELACRCLDTIMQPVQGEYGKIDVGCSIGGVLVEESGTDPSVILRRADLALYQSKASGKGRVTFFEPGMEDAFRTRRALEHSLRASLTNDTFHMVYQPQVTAEGNVPAVEALLRWSHPELGEISPATFIPLAEEAGLIMAIGKLVMRRVFEETADWQHVRVAINVSAIQMRTPGYAAQVMQLAARTGIDPSRYEIELTETALLGDGPATAENFDILRRLGFSIVLDDFGTGYSSLSLLHRFRVDKIKIDRSFVCDLGKSEEVNALVSAIVRLAKSFNLGVIAEGVETEEQRQLLTRAGCTKFQGFLTGAPMPASQIAALVETGAPQRRLA
ncbi:EAL domain-containing protein [Novosphingobium album (ex Hu et al. 2023)]|uniref:EAL domain-containing protein n=1 Tax=Novosphingobium album (ex Hu et al. 2023) TaxID=2930093 RepID=A0ABT0B5P9_9SPHN|nr:EAL domain-containing protein [Novosphingobium album (ex Hu et al. 2023)]MCJ2180402.1 EAL domain-containing protein [Novosphingobium album (ex Hu et al. 2023)]